MNEYSDYESQQVTRGHPEEYYVRIYSWKRKMGIKLMREEAEHLARYERLNGRVPAKTINQWKGMD